MNNISKKSQGYCFCCNDYVDYEVHEEESSEIIRGVKVHFLSYYCVCKTCGELVDVPKYRLENQRRIYDAYKAKVGLLTSSEIREIRGKMGLSAEKFAQYLSLGAKTITRIENGDIQSKEVDKLIRFAALAEENETSKMIRIMQSASIQSMGWRYSMPKDTPKIIIFVEYTNEVCENNKSQPLAISEKANETRTQHYA